MTTEVIQVLQHDIEIQLEVEVDQEIRNEIHDAIHEQIWSGYTKGTVEMFMEINDVTQDIDVKWKIVNVEAEQWKKIATKLYRELKSWSTSYPEESDSEELCREYEALINK